MSQVSATRLDGLTFNDTNLLLPGGQKRAFFWSTPGYQAQIAAWVLHASKSTWCWHLQMRPTANWECHKDHWASCGDGNVQLPQNMSMTLAVDSWVRDRMYVWVGGAVLLIIGTEFVSRCEKGWGGCKCFTNFLIRLSFSRWPHLRWCWCAPIGPTLILSKWRY